MTELQRKKEEERERERKRKNEIEEVSACLAEEIDLGREKGRVTDVVMVTRPE